jgi:hypothetical protein
VAGGWWLVAGGWWLVAANYKTTENLTFDAKQSDDHFA